MAAGPPSIDLADALPRRAIAIRPPPVGLGPLGAILLLLAMLAGVLAWLGPGLVGDWRMRNDWVAATDARVEQAHCRAWLGVVRFCSVGVIDSRDGAVGKRTLWYAFFGLSGEQRMGLRRGRSDPALLTAEFASQRLLSRTAMLALAAALLGSCIAAAAAMLVKGVSARRAFIGMHSQRLTPMVVEIERHNLMPPRRRLWIYLYDDGGRQGRTFVELPARERPLFVSADERWALALRGDAGGRPLLLDQGLSCLDLTRAEKAAFYQACRAALGLDGKAPP
jgi:hypothetical protein